MTRRRPRQQSPSAAVQSLKDQVEAFTAEYVGNPKYAPKLPTDAKIIHDALWGTIRLDHWEVAILDLPLLQRLRQIRQTALVHYVFPGCNHTRFDHTLGVLRQTRSLADAVNEHDQDGGGKRAFDQDVMFDLRLAAMFHDVGHGCFSHISEDLYRFCPDMAAAIADGGEFAKCHPHEVMGHLILKSGPVREYLAKLREKYNLTFNVDRAAAWILGEPADGELDCLYRAQVISGPFDADKLDYIFRDAHFSGLPLNLDLDRLWASCKTETATKFGKKILTLHQACATPLEQILYNKLNLFSVVYQHPKVRAAECMFQGVVELIHSRGLSIFGRSLRKATDYLWITDQDFFAAASSKKANPQLHRMVHDILYRRHFVRALTIARDTVSSPGRTFGRLRQLNQRTSSAAHATRRELANHIWEKANKPCSKHEIWIDLPPEPAIGAPDKTYVRTASGTLRKLSDLFPINYWAQLYMNHKWRGHVFCPHRCQRRVHEAAKSVLKSRFDLTFSQAAADMSHVKAID